MLTVKITKLFARLSEAGDGTGRCYSASQAELGPDAASITWENCRRDGTAHLRDLTDAAVGWDDFHDPVRDYAKSFGAWPKEEIDTWSQTDLHAFLLQDVAAAVREWDLVNAAFCPITEPGDAWAYYQKEGEAGSVSGRLGLGENGTDVYYTIDS